MQIILFLDMFLDTFVQYIKMFCLKFLKIYLNISLTFIFLTFQVAQILNLYIIYLFSRLELVI